MPFLNVHNLPESEPLPGYKLRYRHSGAMTFAFWTIEAAAPLPEHSHPHEQVANVIEGEYELTIDGESQVLRPGMLAVIPPHAPHSGKALTDCRIVDVFCPRREDFGE